MTLPEILPQFYDTLRIRGYRPRTLETTQTNLALLQKYLEAHPLPIETITSQSLEDFRQWLYYLPTRRDTMRSTGHLNNVLSSIKTLFAWLKESGYLLHDPAESLQAARKVKALPKAILSPAEARKIIDKVDTSTLLGYRDKTILEVLYATGIRQSELCAIRLVDLRLDEELLTIHEGKGGYDRVVPLSAIACHHLETYLAGIRPKILKNQKSPWLFISWRGGRALRRQNLGELVKKHARNARIKKDVSCHVWRHTCATHLLQNNANLRHVQAILGHRSLATTERYLRVTINDLKEAHKKHHPREKTTRKEYTE